MGLLLIDNEYLPHLKALIETAKSNIDISAFKVEMTHKPRGTALYTFWLQIIEKLKRGIKVRLLLNWHADRRSVAKTNLYVMQQMKQRGADVRFLRNNRCCHAKFVIIDRKKAIIGSHNLSVRSCHNNFEISYILEDQQAIERLQSVFEHSFYDAQKY